MTAYHFTAINPAGKQQKGVLEGDNEKIIRQQLRDKSLIPVRVWIANSNRSTTTPFSFKNAWTRPSKLSSKDLALLTRQFATLLSAGLPIEESLSAIGAQSEKTATRGLILSVRSKVLEGHALAAALSEHPQAFAALFCATVAAGEKSGHLDKVLLRLAEYTEQQWQMRQKLKTALIYPAMIVLVACAIVGFLLEYVVPKMVAVYSHIHQTLPLLTAILIAISHFVQQAGGYVLFVAIVTLFFIRRRLKTDSILRARAQFLLLRLPFIGNAVKTADTARFARTLSILTASGVSALEAMQISAQLITLIPIRKAVESAVKRVKEGSSIHQALKASTYFPPMTIHMVASGEGSGQLEGMLERVALNQENEISRLIEVSLALFEPAIILIMGAVVLFIVLAVLLPIFQLNQFSG